MQRITEPTAAADPFGTGEPGFTNGNPLTLVGTTELNAAWFNNTQEEMARCVESDGATVVAPNDLATPNYFQLSDAVQGLSRCSCTHDDTGYVLRGLLFDLDNASLVVELTPGEYVFGGRRYVVTAALLAALGYDEFTLTASRDTYFYIAPENPSAPSTPPDRATVYIFTIAVANNASEPATPAGMFLFCKIVSDGTEAVSDSTSGGYRNRGPSLIGETGSGIRFAMTLAGHINIGVSSNQTLLPVGGEHDIGADTTDEEPVNGQWFGHVYHSGGSVRRNPPTTGRSRSRKTEHEPIDDTTTDATPSVTEIFDLADYPNGTIVRFEVVAVAINTTSENGSYFAKRMFIVRIDNTGTGTLNSSAPASPDEEEGSVAIGAGAQFDVNLTGTDDLTVNAIVTGIAAQTMRWSLYVTSWVATYEP